MENCKPCNISFSFWDSLQQHLQSQHSLTYCMRCQKHFPRAHAKQQHIIDSPRHHVCYNCSHESDFDSEEQLNDHLEAVHNICVPCDLRFSNAGELAQHDVDTHNKCELCDRYFSSFSNLENHNKTHLEKRVECFGCPRKFVSHSAMMLHLEAGTCESGADLDFVVDVAFDCHQSDSYTCDDPDFDFQCPTCDMQFVYMSGFFQHVESCSCDEDLQEKPLRQFLNYLRSRL
ncbi:hypothetical protein B0T10DRAFT_260541 [Thelonectria olida]|uniref:C2H2-type domain-containing protein n=1 Tax=Thelonectria olida TaxID=1576542 RepID=A0A9P8VTJ8_9HYPO|nr:hypothetical protein B0T10DRAFT_260541 [Thelonectria olida]